MSGTLLKVHKMHQGFYISAQWGYISWRWFRNIQNESNKKKSCKHEDEYTHCLYTLTQQSRNLMSRFLFVMCQQQAAPTAAWVEAWGERSLLVACIPDLQQSFCHCPMSCCCCSVFHGGRGGLSCELSYSRWLVTTEWQPFFKGAETSLEYLWMHEKRQTWNEVKHHHYSRVNVWLSLDFVSLCVF